MQPGTRQGPPRQVSSGDFQTLFQGAEQSSVQQTYALFSSIIERCDAEQELKAAQFRQRVIPESQVLNLLENISGSFKFEAPKVEVYRKGQLFAKTLAQDKILYSSPG